MKLENIRAVHSTLVKKKKKKENRFIWKENTRREGERSFVFTIVTESRPSLTMMERLIAPTPCYACLSFIVRWRREDKELEGALKN